VKKFLIFISALLFYGCAVPYEVTTAYKAETAPVEKPTETPKEPESMKTLAPIDESKDYIFDYENNRVYLADDLPDGIGHMDPLPILYSDGSFADVRDITYDIPTRHWYIKVMDMKEIITDGVTIGWEPAERIFKQKDGKVTETTDGVFPGYNPACVPPVKLAQADLSYIKLSDGEHLVWYPHNQDWEKESWIAGDFTNVSWYRVVGNTLWTVSVRKGFEKPQLFTIENGGREAIARIWLARAAFKPAIR